MNVRITFQDGTLTIDGLGKGHQGGGGGDSPVGGGGGDSPVGGDPGGKGGGCCGGLVLGPIVIPMGSQNSATGGGGGDSPVGGGGGDSPVGGGPGGNSGCCCPTVIGPIVFTGCNSGNQTTGPTPNVRPVNIKTVFPPVIKPQTGPPPPFELETQQEAQWCWAAVAVSVNNFLDQPGTWTQTALASQVLNLVCSAVPNPEDPCDQAFTLHGPLAATGNLFNPGGAKFDQFVQFADLQAYWAAVPYPICVRIAWDDGSDRAHFIALAGTTALVEGQQLVTVFDPSPTGFGPAQWDYDVLQSHYQGPPMTTGPKGHWTDTYFVQP
jgi:hypothetical protein